MAQQEVEIKLSQNGDDFSVARNLILEYATTLGIDLSFQNFDSEINNLKDMYSEPAGGLLLATVNGEPAGVAGIRKYENNDGELKRMFVKADFRNLGIGKKLLSASIELATKLGYDRIKLDTADFMQAAIKLYRKSGFVEIAPYRYNPHESARYFELTLSKS